MKRLAALFGTTLTLLIVPASPAFSQQNRCADCHFANPMAPAAEHLMEWARSTHGRNGVGCEKCHGGDADTFETLPAHRGILNSANPSSPVNERNLAATCGTCHAGEFVAYQKSRHYELMSKGDFRVPGCTTCHGAAGSRGSSSPKTLESQCKQCHNLNGIAKKSEVPEQARAMYEAVNESRSVLNVAKTLVGRVTDKTRKAQLEQAYQQAEVPLIQAVQAGHAFVFDDLKERLLTSRRRIEALLGELANPK